MKKMMALLTIYYVSKQLTRLDITAMCHITIELEMAWKRDDRVVSVSIQRDEMKDVSSCLWQCLQCFYDDDSMTSEHQFTIKKLSVLSENSWWKILFEMSSINSRKSCYFNIV